MNPLILLPIAAGIAVVVQSGVNRQIADQWGLAAAILLNSVVVLALAAVVYFAVKLRPDAFPEFLHVPSGLGAITWWQGFLPGVLGLTIILGLPWAFSRMGALEVILTLLVAQVVASIAWDTWVEDMPVEPLRIVGALVALGGTILAAWKR